MKKASTEGTCDLCGHYVRNRQKAHIVAEQDKSKTNIFMLCPSCHIMFDTVVKPRLHKALKVHGVKGMPKSWTKSIYAQAAEASAKSRRTRKP